MRVEDTGERVRSRRKVNYTRRSGWTSVRQSKVMAFCGLVDDDNLIHYELEAAQTVSPLASGVVVPGALLLGMFGAEVNREFGGKTYVAGFSNVLLSRAVFVGDRFRFCLTEPVRHPIVEKMGKNEFYDLQDLQFGLEIMVRVEEEEIILAGTGRAFVALEK